MTLIELKEVVDNLNYGQLTMLFMASIMSTEYTPQEKDIIKTAYKERNA